MGDVGVATVDDGVTHSLVGLIERDLGTETPLATFGRTGGHFGETSHVFLDRRVATLRGDAVHAFGTHLLLNRVIGVSLALLDHLNGELVKRVEVVRGVAGNVTLDTKELKILDDRLLELFLLLARVGVIESDDELAVVLTSEVLVEDSSLGVTDVEVS